MGDPRRFRSIADRVTLRPFANNHQLPALGQVGDRAHQSGEIFHRAQACQRADPLLALVLDDPAQRIGRRAGGELRSVDPVRDVLHAADGLLPGMQRNPLQHL